MILKDNTILITGGSSGLGLEMAKRFIDKGNTVIICGRTIEKLENVKTEIPEIITFRCDVSLSADCKALVQWISEYHSSCNVLINNAAIVHTTNFLEDDTILEKSEAEFNTNVLGPIRLCKMLAPIIQKNKHPKIINITSGLVFVPRVIYPFYSATKAALHSFTHMLRLQQKNIKIIEVFFPAVATPWHKGKAPKIAISVQVAIAEMLQKLEKEQEEIMIGKVKLLYFIYRLMPAFALKKINSL